MEQIFEASLAILADVGMEIHSEKALVYMAEYGCIVDDSAMKVKIPRQVTRKAVEKMKLAYERSDRIPESMAVRYSHIRFRNEPHRIHEDYTVSTGGFCCYIYDLNGRRRKATENDVLCSINLVNQLDEITYTGLPVSDQDAPYLHRPVKMAGLLATYTHKLGGIETFKKEDIPYLVEIGTIVKGSLADLKREPILVGYAEVRSPLVFDRNMADIFVSYIEMGFPQTLDTMPNGGATAPMTAAGNLAMGIAETLGGLVLAYSIREDAVVGVDIIPSNCDMSSGLFRYASADRIPLLVARVQLISEFLGCPSGVHGGKTDSCGIGVQSGVEKAMTTMFPVLAGAVGIGTVGHLENAVTFSPEQLVIDAEVSRYVRRTLKPIEVNEETLSVDVIKRVGPGGNFLSEDSTLHMFRDELFLSDMFQVLPWESAEMQNNDTAEEKAADFANEHWKHPDPVLSDDQIKAISDVVSRAEQELTR
jgi:trimethylamine---corrinoid protein Co-methyltransferase